MQAQELKEEELEDLFEEDEKEAHDTGDHKRHVLVVTIINEENGRHIGFRAGKKTYIESLIKRMYIRFKVERQQDDRLRCEGNGEDVFAFSSLRLGEYLDKEHCPNLVWLFAGGTGGA